MAPLPRPDGVDVAAAEKDAAAWAEALDIDDSDLRLNPPSSSGLLHPSTAAAPNPDKPSDLHHGQRVPGPASALQDAMRLRADGASPVLARVDAQAADADFLLHPWLSALLFLVDDRAWEQPGIREIKADRELDRAPLVMGVVTSCKPNGFGDLSLTLKDPTDTICASVHKKVLAEGSAGQDISVGSVVILSKVAVFRPSHKACYLNVTKEKLIKVMRKDCGPPSLQDMSSFNTSLRLDRGNNVPSYIASQQSLKTVNSEIPANWQQRQGSVPMFERSEADDCANKKMVRLLGCETMVPSRKEMAAPNVSGDLHRAPHSSIRTHTASTGTDWHPQQSFNIPDLTCPQPTQGENSILGDRTCTRASDNKKLRLLVADDLALVSRKKLKTYDSDDAIMNTSMGTESKHRSEYNKAHGDHTSTSKPEDHQQDFCAANAGTVQPTKETSATDATDINVSLLSHPKKVVSVASVAGWTDEQLSELFDDY